MLVPPARPKTDSKPDRRARHGSSPLLTTPASDPLGLAAEIYFGRTGRGDYAIRLADLEDPTDVHGGGDISDESAHPFQFIKAEQGRYNARVQMVQAESQHPERYRVCRNRWYWNLDPERAKTSACMAIWCPGCWMTKIERAYTAITAAAAPVFGVTTIDCSLSDTCRDVLTEQARRSLVVTSRCLSAREQDKCWHPLYWALFPVPGAPEPMYRFAGIFVAAQPVNRRPDGRSAQDILEHGVTRRMATVAGGFVEAWEQTFTGPDRVQSAWDHFRRHTLAPVMTSSEDGSCPGYSDGDAIRAEGEEIKWTQTQRAYGANLRRYADLPQELSVLEQPRLDPEVLPEVYGDARLAHATYLTQVKAFRDALHGTPANDISVNRV